MASSPSWSRFCPVSGSLHEHLIYCRHCHARNPQVSHPASTSHSVRKEVVEIPDSPPSKTSLSTTTQIASQFPNYSCTQAEEHRKSHQSSAFR